MDGAAVSHHKAVMIDLQKCGVLSSWITVEELWDPDLSMLWNYGSVIDVDSKFGRSSRLKCYISPQLSLFIKHRTEYKQPVGGHDPTSALLCLLHTCFIDAQRLFLGAWSTHNLLVTSKLAFMRAVVAASIWLGPSSMPAGYVNISDWPPHEGDGGL